MIFNISDSDSGATVLSFLRRKLNISHKSLMYLKHRENGITANGVHVTVRYVLKSGDILEILECDNPERTSKNISPNGILPDIIYEDDSIIAFNKPPHMPTHPSHNHTDDTLANEAAELYLRRSLPFVFRPAGRLDRNTSGVVIASKTQAVSSCLFNAAKSCQIHKKYIAILCGIIPCVGSLQKIEKGIIRTDDSIIMRTVCKALPGSPEWAETEYRVLAVNTDAGLSLVEAMPITGRTHQLRVHFSSIGHPILGDDLYGQSSELIDRHALHAYTLDIPKPFDSLERLIITAPLPTDMTQLIHKYFSEAVL